MPEARQPFYFRSFERVIGVAHDEAELLAEVKRLSAQDPKALEYHVSQGHIVEWLRYIGRDDLASFLEVYRSSGLASFVEALEMALEGSAEPLTCPYCGYTAPASAYRLARAPWRFGAYAVRLLVCPSCGRRFRYYFPLREGPRAFTVPRLPEGQR